jgi:cell division septation protein DedD
LAKQPLSIVKDFIEDRQANGYIVNTEDSMIVKPKQAKPGTEESLPPNVLEMINQAVAAVPGSPDAQKAFRAKLVATHLAEHTENISAALNGAGRY